MKQRLDHPTTIQVVMAMPEAFTAFEEEKSLNFGDNSPAKRTRKLVQQYGEVFELGKEPYEVPDNFLFMVLADLAAYARTHTVDFDEACRNAAAHTE